MLANCTPSKNQGHLNENTGRIFYKKSRLGIVGHLNECQASSSRYSESVR